MSLRYSAVFAAAILLASCTDQVTTPSAVHAPSDPEAYSHLIGERRTGYIRGPDGAPMLVSYVDAGGVGYYQGDIVLGPVNAIPTSLAEFYAQHTSPLQRGAALDCCQYRWGAPAPVPYVIDGSIQYPSRITSALGMVQQATVTVGFVQRTTQTDYIKFLHSDSVCDSYVGRQSGQQVIHVAEAWCLSGSIAHEVLHALGMWHEQSRCDRDFYVEIEWQNIIPEDSIQFAKECAGSSDRFDYDESSIMHYDQHAFCVPDCPGPTIVSLRGLGDVMGQRDSLTVADRGTVTWMYPPWVTISSGPRYGCQGGTYSWTASGQSGYQHTGYMWYRQWEGSNTWEGLDGGAQGTLNVTIGSSDPSFTLRVIGHYWVGGSVSVDSSPYDEFIEVFDQNMCG